MGSDLINSMYGNITPVAEIDWVFKQESVKITIGAMWKTNKQHLKKGRNPKRLPKGGKIEVFDL